MVLELTSVNCNNVMWPFPPDTIDLSTSYVHMYNVNCIITINISTFCFKSCKIQQIVLGENINGINMSGNIQLWGTLQGLDGTGRHVKSYTFILIMHFPLYYIFNHIRKTLFGAKIKTKTFCGFDRMGILLALPRCILYLLSSEPLYHWLAFYCIVIFNIITIWFAWGPPSYIIILDVIYIPSKLDAWFKCCSFFFAINGSWIQLARTTMPVGRDLTWCEN